MARVLQVKRGLKANIPTLAQAEFGFTTDADAEELYIGTGNKNIKIARADDVSLEKIGAAGAEHTHEGKTIKPAYIEFGTGASTGHGGVLDFHFNGSTEDFTSRIMESASGKLNLLATNGVVASSPAVGTSAVRNIYAGTSDMTAGTSTLNTGDIYFVYE